MHHLCFALPRNRYRGCFCEAATVSSAGRTSGVSTACLLWFLQLCTQEWHSRGTGFDLTPSVDEIQLRTDLVPFALIHGALFQKLLKIKYYGMLGPERV